MTFEDARTTHRPADGPSRVIFDIEPIHHIVRLTVTHENLADQDEVRRRIPQAWSVVIANLKSKLETGHVLSQAPWEMHAEQRAAAGSGTQRSAVSRSAVCWPHRAFGIA